MTKRLTVSRTREQGVKHIKPNLICLTPHHQPHSSSPTASLPIYIFPKMQFATLLSVVTILASVSAAPIAVSESVIHTSPKALFTDIVDEDSSVLYLTPPSKAYSPQSPVLDSEFSTPPLLVSSLPSMSPREEPLVLSWTQPLKVCSPQSLASALVSSFPLLTVFRALLTSLSVVPSVHSSILLSKVSNLPWPASVCQS